MLWPLILCQVVELLLDHGADILSVDEVRQILAVVVLHLGIITLSWLLRVGWIRRV